MATARVQPESEAYLLELVRSGDHEAFYELVRPHERGIYLAALSIVNNDADAKEVVQEAILKAFKAIARFRAEAKFSTWIIQIAINEARMKLRRIGVTCMTRSTSPGREKMRVTTFPETLRTGEKYLLKHSRMRAFAKPLRRGWRLCLRNTGRCWFCVILNI